MKISEIFHSLQGEGKLLGMPSAFIRLSGCNLRCVWCDTPYASWDAGTADVQDLSIPQIVAKIEGMPPVAHAVITGGEPMMFKETADLIAALKQAGKHITVETAGTLWLDNVSAGGIDLASISPKLSNSTPHQREGGRFAPGHERQRINLEVLKKFATSARGAISECQWKFVISEEKDLVEMNDLLAQLNAQLPLPYRIQPPDVLLMPEGIDEDTLNTRSRWLADICKQSGHRLSPRLHVHLWGNRRGT